MDRDMKANTRCTWFTQIGYVHGIEEFSLIVKGLHKYIGSSSPLVDVASSLEVLFLHPGVVSLTGGDAQGVPQVAELGGLLKEVTDKSIRLTEEFEGQNKSIKSRVRSTLLIWDTFAFDRVMDVSARVLLRLSPHASLYPSHLPYLFLKQMRNLPWKHKMLKMSTREQCQYSLFAEVLSGGKKAEYFERLRWECPLRYDEGLSIFAGLPSTLKKWSVVSGSRDSENDASSIFEKAIMLGSTLPRSTEVDTQGLSNYPAVSDVVGAASFTCSTLAENFGKVICEVFYRMPIISAKLSVRVTGADKAGKVGASSISEIGPRGLWGAQLLRKRAPLRFLRSAFVAPLRFLKLRRVQIFIGAGIKFQSTLESPPTAPPSPDNIWRPSFVSPTGPLTVGDSVMKNDMTAAVVARNLLTPKDNRLLSKRSDELAVKDSLALSVQCAGSVSNMAQRLFARTRQVESLAADVMSLKQEIRGLKHENKQLHRLAHDYATNMKRKLDQMKETDGQVLLDHQRFVGLFQRHLLPSSSGAVPRNEAPNDQPLMPPPSRVLSSTEAPNDPPPVPSLSGALPTAETSPKQPL
ncbi:hypothetical protein ACFX1R_013457 [Malus domestica]